MSFRIGMIGLDTSHSVEFPRLFQSDVPAQRQVDGLQVVSCLRFASAFCTEEVQDQRQQQLQQWGVKVTRRIEEALQGIDGVMIEINDPALHLQYCKEVARLGKPVFLDKPLAATMEEGREIFRLAEQWGIPFWSASSLRFNEEVQRLRALPGGCCRCGIVAPLGKAPAGSDIVWYGVHGVEMVVTIMGADARAVFAREDHAGVAIMVDYGEKRRGLVDLSRLTWNYSGDATSADSLHQFAVTPGAYYSPQMQAMKKFFCDGVVPVARAETLLVQAILNAADVSRQSGKEVVL